MVAWTSYGAVLRWWRTEIRGLTQGEAAACLNVKPSSLSNWERGAREISIPLEEIDEGLKGDGVLGGLMWACSTPRGLEPGKVWTKVFPGQSAAVWMWIRSPSARLTIEGEWGVARLETELELGPNGAFITVGASVPDSPVVVDLGAPGWADFGWGELPSSIPDAEIIPAVKLMRPSRADGAFMDLFRNDLATKLHQRSRDVVALADKLPRSVFSFVSGRRPPTDSDDPPKMWPPDPEGIDAVERERFARLRDARKMSLVVLSQRVARITGVEVSRDTLRRFENDVGRPHHPQLPVALDVALGAGGRLAVLELRAGRGPGTVTLPPFWRGPVWLNLRGPTDETPVLLRRGDWQRPYLLQGEVLLSFHWFDPAVPLRIDVGPEVAWATGIGRRAGAEAIDQNWTPRNLEVAREAVELTEQAIMSAADRTADGGA
ncbi:MAG: helix-turn-helix domain-containing protein [Acidimicrobiales bacterium]